MMQDLVLLGLLKEGPKHGYEIKKDIEDTLSIFTTVDSKSIYYPLRRLERKGLVVKSLGRKGKRPEKFIYKITREGEKVFEQLFNANVLTFTRPIFNVDLSLFFLPLVKSGIARSHLRSRLRGMGRILQWLEKRRDSLEQAGQPYHLRAIIDHQITLTKADIQFTRHLIKTLTFGK